MFPLFYLKIILCGDFHNERCRGAWKPSPHAILQNFLTSVDRFVPKDGLKGKLLTKDELGWWEGRLLGDMFWCEVKSNRPPDVKLLIFDALLLNWMWEVFINAELWNNEQQNHLQHSLKETRDCRNAHTEWRTTTTENVRLAKLQNRNLGNNILPTGPYSLPAQHGKSYVRCLVYNVPTLPTSQIYEHH